VPYVTYEGRKGAVEGRESKGDWDRIPASKAVEKKLWEWVGDASGNGILRLVRLAPPFAQDEKVTEFRVRMTSCE
jgi:hypothetical protein